MKNRFIVLEFVLKYVISVFYRVGDVFKVLVIFRLCEGLKRIGWNFLSRLLIRFFIFFYLNGGFYLNFGFCVDNGLRFMFYVRFVV